MTRIKHLIICTVFMAFGVLGVIINLYKIGLGIDSYFYLFNEIIILIGIVLITYGFKKITPQQTFQKVEDK